MNGTAHRKLDVTRSALIAALVIGVGAIAAGAAFAGWVTHGAEIFLTMAATGLAWCL